MLVCLVCFETLSPAGTAAELRDGGVLAVKEAAY